MMHEELIRSCRACATGYVGNCDSCMFSGEGCYKQLHKASADALEAQDKRILTLQHEMMAEAESHIAEVNRLNKQIEKLQADVRPVVKAIWKHVQWVVDNECQEGGYWISRCSNCSMPYHTETPFCPHCGADMREES